MADGYLPVHAPKYRAILAALKGRRISSLLDVGALNGAGTATLASALALPPTAVTACDITSQAAERCRARGFTSFVWDAESAPFPLADCTYDLITILDVIEHLIEPDRLLEQLRPQLAPQGVLVISTPNLAYWWSRVRLGFGRIPVYGVCPSPRHKVDGNAHLGHLRVLPTRDWLAFFAAMELRVERVVGYHESPPSFLGLRHKIMQWFDIRASRWPSLAKGNAFFLTRIR
jgi:2-polyprenyl-3-methyl-5-hydroxy-6-metoxy-1,4-benzoquinol methylase